MNNRSGLILVVLFFGGLTALWLADWLQVPTTEERLARQSRVLPELMDVTIPEVGRVEVSTGQKTMALVRQGRDWRIVEPVNARADASTVDLLIQAMKDLRKPPEAEPLKGDLKTFGLEPPERVVRIFGKDGKTLLATLELGQEYGPNRYVRAQGAKSAELAEALLLKAVDLPVDGWRDRLLFDVASFGVSGFQVKGEGRTLSARRENQTWTLTQPIRAPGDGLKLEGLVGGLTSIRVVEGDEGYVVNDAKDLKPYGLDAPSWTITLETGEGSETVEIGAPAPGDSGRFYARRVPENDVVIVPGQFLTDLESDPHLLRANRVAQLNPSKVDYIIIKAGDIEHRMKRTKNGWTLLSPVKAEADAQRVENLIALLNGLQVVEFYEAGKVKDPRLDRPESVISVWESSKGAAQGEPTDTPTLRLTVGRRNLVGRILYAQAEGDPAVLGLPVDVLEGSFEDRFAFVEHRLTDIPPGRSRIFERTGPGLAEKAQAMQNPREYGAWVLVEPVKAKADRESMAMLDHLLNPLRADRFFERESTPDLATYGLEVPWSRIAWTTSDAKGQESRHVLRLGDLVPQGSGARYAMIEGDPTIFSLNDTAVRVATVEMHERRVLDFTPSSASRLVLRRPSSEKVFRRTSRPFTGGLEWTPAPGTSLDDVDVTTLDGLVAEVSALRVERFVQFEGPFPPRANLDAPALGIEIDLRGGQGSRRLRIGARADEETRYATVENGGEGVVFLLAEGPAATWSRFLSVGSVSTTELPPDPFAPE